MNFFDILIIEVRCIPKQLNGSSNNNGELTFYVNHFHDCIKRILDSQVFNQDDFKRRKLHLCESYCLLWQSVGISGLDLEESMKLLRIGKNINADIIVYTFTTQLF